MGATTGGRYWVEALFSAEGWHPDPYVRPIYHHRSRLEFDNLDEFPELAAQREHRMRFSIELTKSDIDKIPDRYEWRSVHHARILRIESCAHP